MYDSGPRLVLAEWHASNPDKSEVLLVAGRTQALKFASGTGILVAGSQITFAVKLKSLGVTIDQSLSFNQHVQNIVRTSNFHIKGLRHIRPFLDEKRQISSPVALLVVVSTTAIHCSLEPQPRI